MNNLYGNFDMTKVMFGKDAIHVPMWMVVQNQRDGGVMFAGASRSLQLLYGGDKIHTLILGEIIVRPHIVIATDDFMGYGIQAFWTHMPTPEEWLRNGDVLVYTDLGGKELGV